MNVAVIPLKESKQLAYRVHIASVALDAVRACQIDNSVTLSPSKVQFCNHIISELRIPEYPELFVHAIDGGYELSPNFKHPYRTPRFHRHPEVLKINNELVDASEHFMKLNARHSFPFDFSSDFEKLKMLFAHASENCECVVTALDLGELPNFKNAG